MLKSLQVKNFRAFENLSVDSLGKVNLVVGRNNVGKTSLLEAVHLYVSDDVLNAASRLLRRRQEYSLEDNRTVAFRSLFHLDDSLRIPIEIGEIHGTNQLVLSMMWSWAEEVEQDRGLRLQRRFSVDYPEEIIELEDLEIREVLAVERGGEGVTQSASVLSSRRYPSGFRRREESSSRSLFLPSSGFHDESIETATLWDSVVLTEEEENVLNALRVIEPDIERIVIVQGQSSQRIAMVKLRGKRNMPLRSLGDGMNRLFELALGLISTGSSKAFLVDEIDSGLHFTTLVDVWRLVFRTAAAHQVQVFATTHSWECIEAFQKAASEHPAEGVLIRLEQLGDSIRAETFSEEELRIITRESIEVR